jgi:hypothetical protein
MKPHNLITPVEAALLADPIYPVLKAVDRQLRDAAVARTWPLVLQLRAGEQSDAVEAALRVSGWDPVEFDRTARWVWVWLKVDPTRTAARSSGAPEDGC